MEDICWGLIKFIPYHYQKVIQSTSQKDLARQILPFKLASKI